MRFYIACGRMIITDPTYQISGDGQIFLERVRRGYWNSDLQEYHNGVIFQVYWEDASKEDQSSQTLYHATTENSCIGVFDYLLYENSCRTTSCCQDEGCGPIAYNDKSDGTLDAVVYRNRNGFANFVCIFLNQGEV